MTQRKKGNMNDDMMQLAMAAPMVVAQRMIRMVLAGAYPSARDRKEMGRMSSEKVDAFTESWNTTITRMTQANINLGFDLMRATWSPWNQTTGLMNTAAARFGNATTASMEQSLAPARRRAGANAKRLGRKGA